MRQPLLLAVDEDREALETSRPSSSNGTPTTIGVECLADPDEALRTLTGARAGRRGRGAGARGHGVLADDRAVTCSSSVRQLHPHAKRALLVPPDVWADQPTADAIRDSMALGRIDYYVPSPAGSPDEVFHEAVSSFLLEWARDRRLVPQTVHIVGETWSGRAYELREVFEQCAVPHAFCLAESDEGRELLARAGTDAKLPLMVLPDGRVLSDPSNAEIAEAAGAPAGLEERAFDVVIVGAGPAGLSAAVYGASEGLRILVVDEGGIGGQARSSSLIRNYLGFAKGVSGSRLAEQAYEQASVFGASFVLMHRATALTRSGHRLSGVARGRAARQRESGDPRHRGELPPPGRPLAGGAARRGRLLRRPGLGGARAERQGRVHRRRRKLRRAGGPAPRAVRAPRHPRRARAVARGRDVALPGASDRGDAERGGAHGHRGGRRRRRRRPPATGPARPRHRRRGDVSPPTPSSC